MEEQNLRREDRGVDSAQKLRLGPGTLSKLATYFSITTLEEFYGWARATNRTHAEASLGQDFIQPEHITLSESLEPFLAPETLRQFNEVSRFDYSFGAHSEIASPLLVDHPTAFREIGPPWFGHEVSLINSYMPPIRNQGSRSTSVAFATCAVMEYTFCREREEALDLSEQWQHWNCKRCDGQPKSEGTSLRRSLYLAARDGICEEQHWPYNLLDDPSNRDPNPPPSVALNATKHKISRFMDVRAPRDINVLKGLLGHGHPVAFAIPMFSSVEENVHTRLTGNILVPCETERTLPVGHAMVLVGYEDHEDFAGGGYFIVRNSWGDRWGTQCPFGAGYGTIPYRFIERHTHSAFVVEV